MNSLYGTLGVQLKKCNTVDVSLLPVTSPMTGCPARTKLKPQIQSRAACALHVTCPFLTFSRHVGPQALHVSPIRRGVPLS
jgi:hypothetical protein